MSAPKSYFLSQSSEVEGRLSALEAQLQDLLPALNKLNSLEKRLEELEKCKSTVKVG